MTEIREIPVPELLAEALEVWGKDGKGWCQGHFHYRTILHGDKFCLIGGIRKAACNLAGVSYRSSSEVDTAIGGALMALSKEIEKRGSRSIIGFNDTEYRKYSEIKDVVCRVIKNTAKEK